MNFFESHFWYNKSQRNGILFLVAVIVIFQAIIWGMDHISVDHKDYSQTFKILEYRLDSLKKIQAAKPKYRVYPFNPNYLTDFKGYQLGMTPKEIDRLMAYRKKGLFVESDREFQKITKVSDSLLQEISPLFKFPAWIAAKKPGISETKNRTQGIGIRVHNNDLNRVTAADLITVSGVNYKLAKRIISYRRKLKGYSLPEQLFEVYHLNKETGRAILSRFKILTKPKIKKLNLNEAGFKELLSLPYLDYQLTRNIFKYKEEVLLVSDLNELKKIDSFPIEKFERIALYLTAE